METRAWVRRAEAADSIRESGLADRAGTDLDEAVGDADLVVLAMPVEVMGATLERCPVFRGTNPVVVTDVGSVKGSVVETLPPLAAARGASFLGSHPMAGSEKTGIDYATDNLFEGAPVILTPGQTGEESVIGDLTRFWTGLGARVSIMPAAEHDRLVAGISHLPHLVASALVNSVLGERPEAANYAGGGFRDTTRVASGAADMWSGILEENRDAVIDELDRYLVELTKWRDALGALDRETLRAFLSRASGLRFDSRIDRARDEDPPIP